MGLSKTVPYVQRTTIIDTGTGEILAERDKRLAQHYYQVQRADHRSRQRVALARQPLLTREACDLLVAGSLVTLMGVMLWTLAWFGPTSSL
jgi:hypothetical protein